VKDACVCVLLEEDAPLSRPLFAEGIAQGRPRSESIEEEEMDARLEQIAALNSNAHPAGTPAAAGRLAANQRLPQRPLSPITGSPPCAKLYEAIGSFESDAVTVDGEDA